MLHKHKVGKVTNNDLKNLKLGLQVIRNGYDPDLLISLRLTKTILGLELPLAEVYLGCHDYHKLNIFRESEDRRRKGNNQRRRKEDGGR